MIGKFFLSDETGGTAIEYGLIAALVAIAVITAVTSIETSLWSFFEAATTKINSARPPDRHVPP